MANPRAAMGEAQLREIELERAVAAHGNLLGAPAGPPVLGPEPAPSWRQLAPEPVTR